MKKKQAAAVAHGRGGWTKVGMPANGTGYYQLLTPDMVGSSPQIDQSHRAVNYGVRAIQRYCNQIYAAAGTPTRPPTGIFDQYTSDAVHICQFVMGGLAVDGVVGPKTATAFFWPTIKTLAGTNANLAHTVGAICHLESNFDPGAVGYVIPNDLGLAQINGPANPTVSEAQAFDPQFALRYLTTRMANAMKTYSNPAAAIVSYNNPSWANVWQASGKAPTEAAAKYVDLVHAWKPPA